MSRALLLSALTLPSIAGATGLYYIDNFSVDQYISVGNGTANSTESLGSLSRKLTVTGSRVAQASISVDSEFATYSIATPSNGNSTFTAEYTPTSGSVDLVADGNTAQSTSLYVTLDQADTASSFTWTFTDTANNVATWTQSYAVTASLIDFSNSLYSFSGGATLNWNSIKKIVFFAQGQPNLDADFTNGFRVSYANPVPEPSTYGLILGGVALAAAALRRRRAR